MVEVVANTLPHTVTKLEAEAPVHTLAPPLAEAKAETMGDTLSCKVA